MPLSGGEQLNVGHRTEGEKGSATIKRGVIRHNTITINQEALAVHDRWSHIDTAKRAGITTRSKFASLNCRRTNATRNQITHSIRLIDQGRKLAASTFDRRTMPTLIGTAMNGASRPKPADHTASIGIL